MTITFFLIVKQFASNNYMYMMMMMMMMIIIIIIISRGHGTYESDGKLVASVAGVVERVNRLLCVHPLKSK